LKRPSSKSLPHFLILDSCKKVLRVLEGDMMMESDYLSTPGYDPGNRSGRHNVPVLHEASEGFNRKHSYDAWQQIGIFQEVIDDG